MKVTVEQEYEKLCNAIAEALIYNPSDADALMLYEKLAVQDKLLVKNMLHRYRNVYEHRPFPIKRTLLMLLLTILLFIYLLRSWF